MPSKIVTIVGARPQFVKAAAVSRAIVAESGLIEVMVHTGQHFDPGMSEVFFQELDIAPPAYNLAIHGGGHGDMTGRMLMALEPVLQREAPAGVLIYGDTNSTLAGALAAAKLHIPVIHVEAGLRSYNRRMPEEINRVLVDEISTLLLCPTSASVANLAKEGITSGVLHVGDVMFDATLHVRRVSLARSRIAEDLSLRDGEFAVLTLHRAENTDDPHRLRQLLDYVAQSSPDRAVIFPVHPRTRQLLDRLGALPAHFRAIPPVGYVDMHRLLAGARVILTDSGGLQKEAYFHRVPCITLREETEWVETVSAGWNRLWSAADYAPRQEIDEYGDGHAAEKIVQAICDRL